MPSPRVEATVSSPSTYTSSIAEAVELGLGDVLDRPSVRSRRRTRASNSRNSSSDHGVVERQHRQACAARCRTSRPAAAPTRWVGEVGAAQLGMRCLELDAGGGRGGRTRRRRSSARRQRSSGGCAPRSRAQALDLARGLIRCGFTTRHGRHYSERRAMSNERPGKTTEPRYVQVRPSDSHLRIPVDNGADGM